MKYQLERMLNSQVVFLNGTKCKWLISANGRLSMVFSCSNIFFHRIHTVALPTEENCKISRNNDQNPRTKHYHQSPTSFVTGHTSQSGGKCLSTRNHQEKFWSSARWGPNQLFNTATYSCQEEIPMFSSVQSTRFMCCIAAGWLCLFNVFTDTKFSKCCLHDCFWSEYENMDKESNTKGLCLFESLSARRATLFSVDNSCSDMGWCKIKLFRLWGRSAACGAGQSKCKFLQILTSNFKIFLVITFCDKKSNLCIVLFVCRKLMQHCQ